MTFSHLRWPARKRYLQGTEGAEDGYHQSNEDGPRDHSSDDGNDDDDNKCGHT